MATLTTAQQTALANLYVALFNRAPDVSGFEFWADALSKGDSLFSITGKFLKSPESIAVYPATQTAGEFVSTLYQTVFGRAPDADGMAFWTKMLNDAGGVASTDGKAFVVTEIIKVVSTPLTVMPTGMTQDQYAETFMDRDLFLRKGVISVDFALNVKSDDLVLAKEVLAHLTRKMPGALTPTPTGSEVEAPAPAPVVVAPDPVPAEPIKVSPNKVFTLTNGPDTFVGDIGNDTFNAAAAGTTNSINTHDRLDGGDGIDTLNAELIYRYLEIPKLKNIEVVNVKTLDSNVELDLRNSTGFTHVGFKDGAAGTNGTLYNVGDAALFVSNQTSNAAFTGSSALALSLTLDKVGAPGAPITVDLARFGAGAIASTHNIVVNDAHVDLVETVSSLAVTDVNITATGSSALTLSAADAATVKHVTVTGSGSVNLGGRALTALETFDGGNGTDKLAIAGTLSASARIALGAGDDKITLTHGSAEGATIDGGDGNDMIVTGTVKHARPAAFIPTEVQVLQIGAVSGKPDASVDTVSISILGQEFKTGPVDLTDKSAVAQAIRGAVVADGTLISQGLRPVVLGDDLHFTFAGDLLDTTQPLIGLNGDVDGQHGSVALSLSTKIGWAGKPAVAGSVDTLTGGKGADTFVFNTPDVDSTAGAVTAVITDFETGVDTIRISNTLMKSVRLQKAAAPVSTLDDLLTAADAAMAVKAGYYVGQVGDDAYLVTDDDGIGYTNVIKLAGVGMDGIAEGDVLGM
jgi:Ca2+-binding RTX toxin-like protein